MYPDTPIDITNFFLQMINLFISKTPKKSPRSRRRSERLDILTNIDASASTSGIAAGSFGMVAKSPPHPKEHAPTDRAD